MPTNAEILVLLKINQKQEQHGNWLMMPAILKSPEAYRTKDSLGGDCFKMKQSDYLKYENVSMGFASVSYNTSRLIEQLQNRS